MQSVSTFFKEEKDFLYKKGEQKGFEKVQAKAYYVYKAIKNKYLDYVKSQNVHGKYVDQILRLKILFGGTL